MVLSYSEVQAIGYKNCEDSNKASLHITQNYTHKKRSRLLKRLLSLLAF